MDNCPICKKPMKVYMKRRKHPWSGPGSEKICFNCATGGVFRKDTCKWHLEEKDGYNLEEHDYWETSCDNLFQFNAGGPENNRFKFCPYCGRPIEEENQNEETI